MKFPKYRSIVFLSLLAAVPSARAALTSISIVNPGFNDQSGWFAVNDAELGNLGGTAAPAWSWDPPLGGTIVFVETVLPLEGSGMGLTYAGEDRFSQDVILPTTGVYEFRVKAKALQGTNVGVGYTIPLRDGYFSFYSVGVRGSPQFKVAVADGWTEYSWTTTLEAGTHEIAIGNPVAAVYVIAYDEFSLTLVPEPSVGILTFITVAATLTCRRRI